jgi:H-type small acid-soluble spore protein
MKFNRAEEILNNTKENIDVTYKDSSVWLESADSENQTVNVTELSSSKSMKINAKDLIERGKLS